MWSTRKRTSGSRLGHDKQDIPAFDTVLLHSNLGSLRRNYLSIIATDINVLTFGSKASKRLLEIHHWWLKNKERKVDFRFVKRRFLAAINLIGSAEGTLAPVFLRITHWTKSGLPVSPPGLFPPCCKSWDPRAPMIWEIFSIFRTNCAIPTSYIRADPRTCWGLSRGCCHVA